MVTRSRTSKANPIHTPTTASAVDVLLGQVGTTRRYITTLVVGYAMAFSSSYVGTTLALMLATAALTYTSSMFLAFAIAVIGIVVSIYTATKWAQTVGAYVLSGDIDQDIATAKNKVLGWFGSARLKFAAA